MSILLISDLHLQISEPRITSIFLNFMQQQAPLADALYILGDLFEAWVGDDDNNPFAKKIKHSIQQLTQQGVPCYFIRGNRDVAVGERFANETGVIILDDPSVISIYQRRVLVMHGDLLCTDDKKYQAFRRKVYNPKFRRRFLALPLFIRRLIAAWARHKSKQHTGSIDLAIQDVNQQAVNTVMHEQKVNTLIHGHTHRPATHHFFLNELPATRIVLPAWHDAGYVLSISPEWKVTELTLN